jgi:hypothetical protein
VTSAMQVLEQSVVVFSQNYLPLCRVNIKRAIVLLVTDKAEPLDFSKESGWQIHLPSLDRRASKPGITGEHKEC